MNQPLPLPDDDSVQFASANDPRLARAAARARNRLAEFVDLLRKQPPGVRFLVKAPFRRLDGEGLKHMWVLVSALEGDAFIGKLTSDPHGKTAELQNDTLRIPVVDIEDWLYDRGGQKHVGGFSIPVLDSIERDRRKRK